MTEEKKSCYLCGQAGEILYNNLQDYLFGTEGSWGFRRCLNSDCGLIWIDPQPLQESLQDLYKSYYTHDEKEDKKTSGPFERIFEKGVRLLYSLFKRILAIRRERKRINLMYLKTKHGKLLEVGCGNGERLAKIKKKLNWDVEGIEIDPKAAEIAKKKFNLKVHVGDIDSLSLPEKSFDAIIMNHVIEHVTDPVKLLKTCHKLSKPDGILTITTPNIESLGHKVFCSSWKGFDPPRHFYLFSMKTLRIVAEKAGFKDISMWTTAARADSFVRDSFLILSKQGSQKTSKVEQLLAPICFHIKAQISHFFSPQNGEECVLTARK